MGHKAMGLKLRKVQMRNKGQYLEFLKVNIGMFWRVSGQLMEKVPEGL